uniref:C2H2-type domain-containing protein n=1 Tax=Rhodosorus marinus TaxID=101924 RepID=A0A7S2ZAH1_9RHOD|mmetsp:Transcript_12217/g.50513  ORF Transcript_12217/g.50513 Transcript_12217/m.50513 type:complete len:182 (+) Transcript_12217:252-797(+)
MSQTTSDLSEKSFSVASILHDEAENLLPCLVCDFKCDSMNLLREHVVNEHASSSQPPSCTICGMQFKQRNRLRRHRRAVHEKRRPYQCMRCNVQFAEKNNLLAHMDTVHEQKRNFTCEVCHAKFGRKNNLHRHIQTVHEKKRPYKCKFCGSCYGERGNLLTHVRRKHERQIENEQVEVVAT